MNPSRTLADRFRTQRTERIRVDGNEIHSLVELEVSSGDVIEVVVEQRHAGTPQGLTITSDGDLEIVEVSPTQPALDGQASTDLAVDCTELDAVVLRAIAGADDDDEHRHRVRLWNTWSIDGGTQAWTGNAGIVVEDLELPESADRRLRAWCSDGLGNATFDDLVVVLTIGPDPDVPPT